MNDILRFDFGRDGMTVEDDGDFVKYDDHIDDMTELQAERDALVAAAYEAAAQDTRFGEYEKSYQYALNLAACLVKRYPNAVDNGWRPLGDLLGLLTQIYNMVAGLTPASPPAEPAQVTVQEADTRPKNCRNRLQSEGKSYPKSGCDVSGCRGVFGAICVTRAVAGGRNE